MKTRRAFLGALGACGLSAALGPVAWAADSSALTENGRLRIAVYQDFAPYSFQNQGIDVEIGKLLAAELGLQPEIVFFPSDEDMNDDLRNMVWKGHYLGAQPADVMLHVPVDAYLARNNEQVRIFGPYHVETIAVARHPTRVPHAVNGSAATALEVFTREKIGVETASMPDAFMLSVLNGRLRENVMHYRTVADAVAALRKDEVSAVMASRGELEAALGGGHPFVVENARLMELRNRQWALGMAVKKEREDLAMALDEALNRLMRNGKLAPVFARYGVTYTVPGG